jgi:hypothetical protein
MSAVDYSDPCAAHAALRSAYYAMLGGSRAEEVEFAIQSGGTRRVRYVKADINALREEVRRLEALCNAKTSGKPARFAVVGGILR